MTAIRTGSTAALVLSLAGVYKFISTVYLTVHTRLRLVCTFAVLSYAPWSSNSPATLDQREFERTPLVIII